MRRTIGNTNIAVNAIGLGGMPMSISGRPDEAQSIATIAAFVNNGGDFIDTANVYCLDDHDIGHNEKLIHKALSDLKVLDKVVVATKGGLRRPYGTWTVDGNPTWLRESCEKSLKDLNVDRITLYQLHAIDDKVKFSDSLGELVRLQNEGKILHIGLSNVGLKDLENARKQAAIVSVQNKCNPFYKKDFKNGLIAACEKYKVTYIPYGPVGGHGTHTRLGQHPLFTRLGTKYGASPYQVALAWLLCKGGHILPIPGASKIMSAVDSLGATKLKLEKADIDAIDALPDL